MLIKKLIFLACLLIFTATPAMALNPNDPAPSFTLRDGNGVNFFFSEHIGPKKKGAAKGMVLNFFSSYCEPCKRELPVLNGLVDEFVRGGIEVVIVGFNEDFDRFGELLEKLGVDKPIILADKYGKVSQKYGVDLLPATFFIGADGKVKDVLVGEVPNEAAKIEKLLRKKAGKLSK